MIRYLARLRDALFRPRSPAPRGVVGWCLRVGRLGFLAGRGFHKDFCFERSGTLAFATVISLIPLTVLFFSFAVQLGAGDFVMEVAEEKLIPLVAPDFKQTLLDWIDNNISKDAFAKGLVGLVGLIALLSLVLAALGVFTMAERNCNRIWKTQRNRTYLQKLNTFWVVLTTSPFIITASAAVGKLLMPEEGTLDSMVKGNVLLEAVYNFLVPVSIGFLGFTVLYYFLPYTRVHFRSAVLGGVVAAMLWVISKDSFYLYVARTSSLYGSLAIFPLFLIWIYVNWMIILWGCELAYVHQNLDYLAENYWRRVASKALPASYVGVVLLERVATAFSRGKRPYTLEKVAAELEVPAPRVEEVARVLSERGLLVEDSASPGALFLAKSPSCISLADVVEWLPGESVLATGDSDGAAPAADGAPRASRRLFVEAQTAFGSVFAEKTLADLLDRDKG